MIIGVRYISIHRMIPLFSKQQDYESIQVSYDIFSEHVSISMKYANKNWGQGYRKTEKGKKATKKAHKIFAFRSKKIMKGLKINGCAICGYDKCDAALEFHHTNPEDKKFGVTLRSFSRTVKSIKEEINKCILLCSNCHKEIHNKERIKN